MTLAAIYHDLNPIVFRLGGDWAVRWYGLSYTAGFVIAWMLWRWMARRGLSLIPPARVTDAMLVMVLCTLVGGRLGYALVYEPSFLWTFRADFPFWDLLAINKGGMASHGAMVGLAIGAWWVARRLGDDPAAPRAGTRVPFTHVMDILCLVAGPGILLGRFANYVNGELLGRIVSPPGVPGPWWTVQFPQELLGWGLREAPDPAHTPPLSPAQMGQLEQLVQSVRRAGDSWHDALRWIVERAGQYREQLAPLLSSRHASQVYQAVAEGLVVGLVAWIVFAAPRKPGVVAAWWLISYGVLRVVTEFWRLPDAKFAEGRPLGLSRGQWLSVLMVGVGVALLVWASRRPAARLGGWCRRARAA